MLVFFPTCACESVATGGVSAVQSSVLLFHQLPSSGIGGVRVIPELGIGMKEQILFGVKVHDMSSSSSSFSGSFSGML